jgi:hypothetical protein
VIEGEVPRLACWILDANYTRRFRITSVFDNVEPVRLPMLARTVELDTRKSYWPGMQITGHRLDFDPPGRLSIFACFKQIVPWVESRRALQSRLSLENVLDGFLLQIYPSLLIESLGILFLFVWAYRNVGDEESPAGAAWHALVPSVLLFRGALTRVTTCADPGAWLRSLPYLLDCRYLLHHQRHLTRGSQRRE